MVSRLHALYPNSSIMQDNACKSMFLGLIGAKIGADKFNNGG